MFCLKNIYCDDARKEKEKRHGKKKDMGFVRDIHVYMSFTIMYHPFQLGGSHRHHQRNINTQIFQKLPGRLGFSLSNLVDESVLHEG